MSPDGEKGNQPAQLIYHCIVRTDSHNTPQFQPLIYRPKSLAPNPNVRLLDV